MGGVCVCVRAGGIHVRVLTRSDGVKRLDERLDGGAAVGVVLCVGVARRGWGRGCPGNATPVTAAAAAAPAICAGNSPLVPW